MSLYPYVMLISHARVAKILCQWADKRGFDLLCHEVNSNEEPMWLIGFGDPADELRYSRALTDVHRWADNVWDDVVWRHRQYGEVSLVSPRIAEFEIAYPELKGCWD
jgi:hypothetical protein